VEFLRDQELFSKSCTNASHLDSSNDFVHEFGPLVLVLHLLELVSSGEPGHDRVDGDGQDHDGHTREDGGPQLLVHEETAKCDL
jgi:hypothetical protein